MGNRPDLRIDHESSSYRVTVYHSALPSDEGKPVVQIDGIGPVRINLNDGAIWDADTESHIHTPCRCSIETKEG